MNPPCPRQCLVATSRALNASSLGDWESPIDASDPASIMAATR
jgi:hypothetical protein